MHAKRIGIISLKGGVGKTTTAVNLGAVLAKEFKKKVLLVDANFSSPNLGLHLGIIEHKASMHHVLNRRAHIEDAIYEYDENLHVLPGSLVGKELNPFLLKEKLKSVDKKYDVIIIDSSPALNKEMIATMVASDNLLVVSSPDTPTLSTTMRAVRLAKQKKTPISGIVLNKVRNKKFELSLHDIEEAAGVPVVAVMNDDVKMLEALAETKHIAEYAPKRDITYKYRKLAACVLGESYIDTRIKTKMKNLFLKDIPREEVNRMHVKKEFKK